MQLTQAQKKLLLGLARVTLETALNQSPPPPGLLQECSADPVLQAQGAAFVTLTLGDALRGCIGTVFPTGSLYKSVEQNAIAAALRDPRFPPVRAAELPHLSIEISVMGPLEPVTSPEDIVIGRDGLFLVKGLHRGLLLPQVASEYSWTPDQFIAHTCQKAGLPPDAAEGAQISKFSATVFSEANLGE